jgi:cobalt-zinc-cadmium efflux system outer membrane protein
LGPKLLTLVAIEDSQWNTDAEADVVIERLREAAQAQVFSDVDSAYAVMSKTLTLLRPYKAHYLGQAVKVRDTVTFSYQHGGASLLDFLSAQNDYRSIQSSYLNLIGSYLTAASQMDLAVGREVIQ